MPPDLEKDGLRFEIHESQKENGDVDKAMQKRKGVETTRYYTQLLTNTNRLKRVEVINVKASMDAYIGINLRQWDPESAQKLAAQGRPVNTFNVIKPNIDKVYGQLVMNPNTINFTPINQSEMSKTNIMQSLYEYDYERGGWEKEKHRFVKDLLIHTGVLEMYKDYRHSRLGNVGLRALNRYLDISFDPYWNSDNISDCNYAFKSDWKTARELKDIYKVKSEEIDRAIRAFEARDGVSDFSQTEEQLAQRDNEFYDVERERYRVVEVIYMQKVHTQKQYKKKVAKFLDENENPDVMRGDNETVLNYTDTENICKVMTMVPGIEHGLILQEGDHPIQVGHLPFFVASSDNTMGERQGLVTGMIDAQITLNKRTSMITGNQITSTNGALIVKQGYFKDAAEDARFKKDRNVPGMVFYADDNAKLTDGIMAVPTGQEAKGLEESVAWTETYMEKYTNSTAAVSGRSEGANESGVLFESKKSQSQIAHVGLAETIAQIDKMVAEAYFYSSKKMYGNGVTRTFTNAKTADQFSINEYLANGDSVNVIADLPRHDVVIKRSELGLDQKQRSLSIYNEMMQRSTNPILKSLYEKAMIPLMEVPEQLVEPMELAADAFVELQMAQTKNNVKLLVDGMIQSDINTKMLQAQAGQAQQPGVEAPAPDQAPDARTVANGPGNGNLPEALAQDSSGANNQAASDV